MNDFFFARFFLALFPRGVEGGEERKKVVKIVRKERRET